MSYYYNNYGYRGHRVLRPIAASNRTVPQTGSGSRRGGGTRNRRRARTGRTDGRTDGEATGGPSERGRQGLLAARARTAVAGGGGPTGTAATERGPAAYRSRVLIVKQRRFAGTRVTY